MEPDGSLPCSQEYGIEPSPNQLNTAATSTPYFDILPFTLSLPCDFSQDFKMTLWSNLTDSEGLLRV
jgi:hypothetical protein